MNVDPGPKLPKTLFSSDPPVLTFALANDTLPEIENPEFWPLAGLPGQPLYEICTVIPPRAALLGSLMEPISESTFHCAPEVVNVRLTEPWTPGWVGGVVVGGGGG